MDQIKALIFDFGGVLTNPVWESFEAFCAEEGIEPDTIKRLFREDPGALADLRELETGALEETEFERGFAERLGLDRSEGLIERLFVGMRPLDEMLDAVRAARAAGLKTALLSNSWSVDHYDRELLAELFDVVVISAEVEMHKPQAEIYALTAERLEIDAAECVFIDDLRENCEGAEAVGMTAVLHRDPAQTIAQLEQLTSVVLG
ncbi:MAG: HAD family hydrolase [Solirubrobacterales bacterium]